MAFCGRRKEAHRVHAGVMQVAAFIARDKLQGVIIAEVTSTVTRGWTTFHWRRKSDEQRKEVVNQNEETFLGT